MLTHCDSEQMNALCEVCLNILRGHVPLKPEQKKKLGRYKHILRMLANRNVSNPTKRAHLKKPQTGGFLPILASLLPAVIGALTSAFQR